MQVSKKRTVVRFLGFCDLAALPGNRVSARNKPIRGGALQRGLLHFGA
jgi:hypothetical protein